MDILQFIIEIRNSHTSIEDIYMNGSCYNFHLILRHVYPSAVLYYNGDHVISRIGDNYYDIRGEVDGIGYSPIEEYHCSATLDKILKEMYE